jgi:hypothetical protein
MVQYCGVVSLDPADSTNSGPLASGISPLLIDTAVAHINGALQEIHDVSPSGAYYRRIGTILQAPQSVDITVADQSNAVVVTGWQDWMNGCSVIISGSVIANEFLSQTQLRRPFSGTAGTYSAQVYNDTIILADGILSVRGPVEIPQIRLLDPASSREVFYTYEWNRIYGDDYGRGLTRIYAAPKIAAQPRAYYTEREQTDTGSQVRLQVLPVPDQQYFLHYGVITDAISITAADIGTTSDPWDAGESFGIPGGWDESVLLPMALKRFSISPNFGNGNPLLVAELDRQFKKAVDILQASDPNRAETKMVCKFR